MLLYTTGIPPTRMKPLISLASGRDGWCLRAEKFPKLCSLLMGAIKSYASSTTGQPTSNDYSWGTIVASICNPCKGPSPLQNSLLEVHYGSTCSCAQFCFMISWQLLLPKALVTNFLHANLHGKVHFLGLSSSNSWCQKWSLEADVECDFGVGSVSNWLAMRTWPQTIRAILTAPGTWYQ